MLNRVLKALRELPDNRLDELAARLNLPEEVLKASLEHLERLGYVRRMGVDACREDNAACTGCAMQSQCAAGLNGTIWALTPKGFTASEKPAAGE